MHDPTTLLRARRREVLARLEALDADHRGVVDASRDANADDEHDPEGSTIAFERSQIEALARQARSQLAEIDEALDRVACGTYGRCSSCGGPIAPARLEARPTARTCVTC